MIDLKTVSEIKNVLNNKLVEKIEDDLGNIIWEGWKKLIRYGIPPLTLTNCKENNLLNYQIYGNSKQERLPDGYTELEYIESTGTQYIDISFIPNQDTRVVMDFQLTSSSASGYALFGVRVSTNSKGFTFQKISNGYWGGMYGDTLVNGNTKQFDTNRHIVNKNKNMVYLDGTTLMSFDSQTFTCTGNMYLFAMNNNGEATVATQPIRLFSFKVYDNGTLVRNMIPCKSPSDEIGLYDTKNNVFYTNAGTGTFTAGTEIKLPDGYTRIDYIEADGNQYLDTGIVPDANTQVDYKVRFSQDALQASPLMGVRLGTNNNNRYFPIAYNIPNTDYRTSFGLSTGTVSAIDFNIDYEGSFQPQNEVSIINGTSYSLSGNNFSKSTNYNMYLFATLGYTDNLYQSKGVIYYCKMIKNNNLLRYFIPCINNQGVVGMYDLVSKGFFSSETSTGFIAGTQAPNPTNPIEIQSVGDNETGLPVGYKQLDYIQSTGGQYIDTNYLANLNTRIVVDFDFTIDSSSDAFSIFGSRTSASNADNIGVIRGSQSGVYGLVVDFGNYNTYRTFYETSSQNTRFKADLSKYGRYIFDSQGNVLASNTTVNTATFTSANSLLLFKQYNAPSATGDYKGKVYSCKIYENNKLVRNFVPCKNTSNVVGMYDTVNKVFYPNLGTGAFTAGNEIAKGGYKIPVRVGTETLPKGYTQLSYIQSTGEQYIDTNYVPNAQTKIQAVVAFTEDTGSMQNFGAISNLGTSSRVNYARWHFGVFSNKLCVFRENTTQSGDIRLDYDDKFHIYEITNTSCSLDDTTKDITLYTNSNITFTLFARNGYTSAGGTASITAYSKSKLKSFKIYENDVLIRDFIPCKNPDNVVGLYDIINNVFYVNQGTGDFIAGEQVSEITNIYLAEPLRKIGDGNVVKLPSGYTQLEYIESTGTQYINTGIIATNNTGMNIKYCYTAEGPAGVSGIFKSATPRQDVFFISTQTGSLPGQAFVAHRGRTTGLTLGEISLNTDYIAKINYKNDGKIYFNEDYIVDIGTNAIYNATIPLFARYSVGGTNYSVSNSRIYYVEFTEGNTISHKFIPCINDQNVIGMYDIVNDIFYSNEGTGTFIAGSPVYADYLDFENQKVIRNVSELIVTGYEDNWEFVTALGANIARLTMSNEQLIPTSINSEDELCNYFSCKNITTSNNVKGASVYYSSTGAKTYFRARYDGLTNLSTSKEFFKNLYDLGTPVKIYYMSLTPTEETIELPEVLLNKGTNIIDIETSLTPSNLWLKYKGKEG